MMVQENNLLGSTLSDAAPPDFKASLISFWLGEGTLRGGASCFIGGDFVVTLEMLVEC
jgi:hypothetical protein